MMGLTKTGIQWSEFTWNPTFGCTKVSPGCKKCYAERIALSMAGRQHPAHGSMWRQTQSTAFKFRLRPERLEEPLKQKKPSVIFVDSMSDLFHEESPAEYIDQVFDVMEKADWHVYQVLTKRPAKMLGWVEAYRPKGIAPHIWLGTSVELPMFLSRIDYLRQIRVRVKFVSFEPLLGEMPEAELRLALEGISWAITGGESDYKDPRPADPEWFRRIRDVCAAMGIPYFHKQNGGRSKCQDGHDAWGCRLLDGKVYDGFPVPNLQSAKPVEAEAVTLDGYIGVG